MNIEVYTDGSATTKDKPGGYGWVLVVDGEKKSEGCGAMENATNNDAEMEAAIQGLGMAFKYIMEVMPDYRSSTEPFKFQVFLVSDSQLILGWASGEYSFKQASKIDQYNKLQSLVRRMRVKTRWVRGHTGDEHNERCDALANEARLSIVNRRKVDQRKAEGKTCIGTKKSGVIALWYKNSLKIIDLETNIVENYDREVHGPRGSMLEIKEDRTR